MSKEENGNTFFIYRNYGFLLTTLEMTATKDKLCAERTCQWLSCSTYYSFPHESLTVFVKPF